MIAALALSSGGADAAPSSEPCSAAQKTVVIYSGYIDASSAERFTDMIVENVDNVIGLKISVEKSKESDKRYYSSSDKDGLNITSGNPMDAPTEVLVQTQAGTTAAGMLWTADGFFLVKAGGSFAAGATSWAAVPVDEAQIRLNPNICIIERDF